MNKKFSFYLVYKGICLIILIYLFFGSINDLDWLIFPKLNKRISYKYKLSSCKCSSTKSLKVNSPWTLNLQNGTFQFYQQLADVARSDLQRSRTHQITVSGHYWCSPCLSKEPCWQGSPFHLLTVEGFFRIKVRSYLPSLLWLLMASDFRPN